LQNGDKDIKATDYYWRGVTMVDTLEWQGANGGDKRERLYGIASHQ